MKEILIPLFVWLCSNTEFEKCQELDLPQVSWHTQQYLQYVVDGKNNGSVGYINAIYMHTRKHILLDLTLRNDFKQLKLTIIHELYHYLQYENKTNKECLAENELSAYNIQKKYADEHNIIYNIPIGILLYILTSCRGY